MMVMVAAKKAVLNVTAQQSRFHAQTKQQSASTEVKKHEEMHKTKSLTKISLDHCQRPQHCDRKPRNPKSC